MTIKQRCILEYLSLKYIGASFEFTDNETITITDKDDVKTTFSVNEYYDIINDTSNKLVAFSDLDHNVPADSLPDKWTDIED